MSEQKKHFFKTPLPKLARQFEVSRNQWKEKAVKRAERIKFLEMRIQELLESRDRWKARAKLYNTKSKTNQKH